MATAFVIALALAAIAFANLGAGDQGTFVALRLCTYLLALFSLPRLRDALGLRIWRAFRLIALEYIALVFADDFILAPLQATGFRSYPLSYLPFAVMLVGAIGLRLATIRQARPLATEARGQ